MDDGGLRILWTISIYLDTRGSNKHAAKNDVDGVPYSCLKKKKGPHDMVDSTKTSKRKILGIRIPMEHWSMHFWLLPRWCRELNCLFDVIMTKLTSTSISPPYDKDHDIFAFHSSTVR